MQKRIGFVLTFVIAAVLLFSLVLMTADAESMTLRDIRSATSTPPPVDYNPTIPPRPTRPYPYPARPLPTRMVPVPTSPAGSYPAYR